MGEAFLTRRGGGYAFAQIDVEYPEGSTCTCSNGTRTLTAKTTGGKWIFNIPSAGTWTVTATDGDSTSSKSVSITTKWQIEWVSLSFSLVIFDYTRADNPEWEDYQFVEHEIGSDGTLIVASTNASGNSNLVTEDTFDLRNYSTLNMEYKAAGIGSSNNNAFGLVTDGDFLASAHIPQSSSKKTISADISKISERAVFVEIDMQPTSISSKLTVYRIWAE